MYIKVQINSNLHYVEKTACNQFRPIWTCQNILIKAECQWLLNIFVYTGVSGQWVGAWVILCQRTLYYAIDNCPVKSMDLRKARCIVLQAYSENENVPRTNDKGPNMLVDCTAGALYLRMWTSRETKVRHLIS